MPTTPIDDETLTAEAEKNLSVTTDGVSRTRRAIAELIAIDQYIATRAAAQKPNRGIMFTKLITPGPAPSG
mgnify:CR=1 FL=1